MADWGWLQDRLSLRGRLERVALLAAMLVVVGCTPQLYGYAKIRESDRYIPPSVLKSIVKQQLPQADVILQLGEPDGTNERRNTIGYERCTTSTGYGVFGSAQATDCQRVVIWFDEEGRARAQHSGVAYRAYDQDGFIYSFSDWLAAPPPPPPIEY